MSLLTSMKPSTQGVTGRNGGWLTKDLYTLATVSYTFHLPEIDKEFPMVRAMVMSLRTSRPFETIKMDTTSKGLRKMCPQLFMDLRFPRNPLFHPILKPRLSMSQHAQLLLEAQRSTMRFIHPLLHQ